MDTHNADFNFLAHRFGILTAIVATISSDNPELQYRIDVHTEEIYISVYIGHHCIRMKVPVHGHEVRIEEKFLDATGTVWGDWELVSNWEKYEGIVRREKDIVCAMTHDFTKLVWKGIIQANKPCDGEDED